MIPDGTQPSGLRARLQLARPENLSIAAYRDLHDREGKSAPRIVNAPKYPEKSDKISEMRSDICRHWWRF